MMPEGYEVSILQEISKKGIGIFACNAFAVFSSQAIGLSPGPPRIVAEVIGSLHCDYGGKWHLALNTEVFLRVWQRVFDDNTFLQNDWTVKVDPDAVFLPSRLKFRLLHSDPDAVVYLNNCDQGLHGPIEIVSRGGMVAFKDGIDNCNESLHYEWNEWGEDVFVRHCMGILNVSRVDDFTLLSEQACLQEDPVQEGCFSGKVCFHPFKTLEKYSQCLAEAEGPMGHRPRLGELK